ncbi:HTH-type transcriptional regulator AceR [Acinetobacter larvae]|uniref:LysR family transcriptional regulator n=1 Tax=Acinetobacter larvae TaxID=1789224 RepID=A0A1B2LYI3_9GAMM|nr:LysR family transcriptional regulator [Acinetobacter larvae]AOA58000.1 LysR family transcriptional regulator [Acinetobacter larvae]
MNINQEQLIIFKTVMETGSFSAAARKLGKVPSAISMSIANLEIDLHLTLFERQGREPRPTPQARTLYHKTEQLLIEMKQWRQHANALSAGLESELNIVVVSELSHSNWTDFLPVLAEQFPELQVNTFFAPQEDALKLLMNESVQLAFMFEREQLASSEQFVEVNKETLIAVAAKNSALAQYDQVSYEQILQSRQIVVASRDRQLKPELLFSKQNWRTDNHYTAGAMILRGLGWGVLPLDMFKENPVLQKQLKVLKFSDFTPNFEYYVDLVWSRESQLGAAARFLIDYARQRRQAIE